MYRINELEKAKELKNTKGGHNYVSKIIVEFATKITISIIRFYG